MRQRSEIMKHISIEAMNICRFFFFSPIGFTMVAGTGVFLKQDSFQTGPFSDRVISDRDLFRQVAFQTGVFSNSGLFRQGFIYRKDLFRYGVILDGGISDGGPNTDNLSMGTAGIRRYMFFSQIMWRRSI